jgi:hypothetical protein
VLEKFCRAVRKQKKNLRRLCSSVGRAVAPSR